MNYSLFTLIFLLLSLELFPSNAKYDVLGIGTAITDILIPVDDAFLEKHNFPKGGSRVVPMEQLDALIIEAEEEAKIMPGGSTANMLKGLAKLGVKTAFHTRDGIDPYGKQYENSLRENNVLPLKIDDPNLASGRVICFITPDKNRTFVAAPGAADAFSAADLNSSYMKEAKIVHVEGYTLRNNNLTRSSMQLAKEHGALISFDPGNYSLVEQHKEQIVDLLTNYIDIVFMNEDEIKTLYALPAEEGCKLLSKIVPVTVILLGDRGCLIGFKEKVLAVPARRVTPKDTTGAGDLFTSGFLYGMLQGYELVECAKIGNYLGSEVVQEVGAEISSERWCDLKKVLKCAYEG